MTNNKLTTKRFVIRKSLLGKNTIISFTNKKGDTITYNHDKVYKVLILTIFQHFVETYHSLYDMSLENVKTT